MPAPQEERVYLGIDPGYADLGYGVVVRGQRGERCVAYGSLRTSKDRTPAERLGEIYAELERLIETYRPAEAAVERLFFSKNAKTALAVAEARGVILLCLNRLSVPTREFNPVDVKMAVCGHGRADKKEMQRMVQMLLGLKEVPKPDDAADALALALAVMNSRVGA